MRHFSRHLDWESLDEQISICGMVLHNYVDGIRMCPTANCGSTEERLKNTSPWLLPTF